MSSTENNKTELDNEKKSKPNTLLSLILICIAFIVPWDFGLVLFIMTVVV